MHKRAPSINSSNITRPFVYPIRKMNEFSRDRELVDTSSKMIFGERYLIEKVIGRGGIGIVYLATDMKNGGKVAIKIREHIDPKRKSKKRITREIYALRGVDQKNVVSMKDCGVHENETYIVMEYMKGLDLEEFLKQKGPLSWELTKEIFLQICDGFEALHMRGIVHRDASAKNIFLREDGVVKIFDFDLARFTRNMVDQDGHVKKDSVAGTAHYMSPEAIRSRLTNFRSDIYSLGILMYKMLTGKYPYVGKTSISVILKILKDKPALPSTLIPEAKIADEIIMKAIEKRPRNRFHSIMRFREAIQGIDSPNLRLAFEGKHLTFGSRLTPLKYELGQLVDPFANTLGITIPIAPEFV